MRKNLLFIFMDQWNKECTGFGAHHIMTPNIDQLKKDGTNLTNCVSNYPLCSPARASLLTGKHAYGCGFYTNCKPGLDEVVMLKPQEVTIAKVLKKQGYQTGYIGKWHLDASEMNFYSEPKSGARKWDAYTPSGERRQGFDYWYSYGAMDEHLHPHYWMNDEHMILHNEWSPSVETRKAIEFLETINKEAPFCLYLSYNPPHPPYDQVPEKYRRIYQDCDVLAKCMPNVPDEFKTQDYVDKVKDYYAAVTGVDDHIGMLMSYLKEHNLYDNTTIVVTSDHGDLLGSHGGFGKGNWYEESIGVPCIIKDREITSKEYPYVFSTIDFVPTLLDLLDIEIPDTVQGKSHGRLTYDNGMKDNNAIILTIGGMPDVVNKFRKYGLNHKSFGYRGVRTQEELYVINNFNVPFAAQKRLLYHLKQDPYEMNPEELNPDDSRCEKYDEMIKAYCTLCNDPFLFQLNQFHYEESFCEKN